MNMSTDLLPGISWTRQRSRATNTITDRCWEKYHVTLNSRICIIYNIPTGSGKTTLLNVISGRLKPDSGSVTLNGVEFTKRERRRMAFVQQQDVFFTHLTVWETLYVRFAT